MIKINSTFGFVIVLVVLLTACATQYNFRPNEANHDHPKYIGIFIDGTNNDSISDTNVSRLRNIAMLQKRDEIHTLYINGVGTEGGYLSQAIGMFSGNGYDEDIQNAFIYLGNTFRHENDKIAIFGFSRGAYTARILAGLISTAGIPDFSDIDQQDISEEKKDELKQDLAERVFDAFHIKGTKAERITSIQTVSDYTPLVTPAEARIAFMGLWDTVPAIGIPDFIPDYSDMVERKPEKDYDQLCNIDAAAHAASIDDNRARVFDFLSLTYLELLKDCPERAPMDSFIDEVWFSGAHSDVGGGNNTDLSGVSLNWMISRVQKALPGFLPQGAQVFEDPLGQSTTPSEPLFRYVQFGTFGNRNRHFIQYASSSPYNGGKPKIHTSVKERIEKVVKKDYEFCWSHPYNNFPRQFPATGRLETDVGECVELLPVNGVTIAPANNVDKCIGNNFKFRLIEGNSCFVTVGNN